MAKKKVVKKTVKKSSAKKVSAKKSVKKPVKKGSEVDTSKTLHYWNFPGEGLFLMKLETLVLTVLSMLVFFVVLIETNYSLFPAAAMTLFFILVYFGISSIARTVRKVEEHYHVKHDGLEIIRFVGNSVERVHILWEEVKKYKLDRFLLGAYLLTKDKKNSKKDKRHSVYFSKVEDLEKVEELLLKKK